MEELFKFTITEARRLGLEINMNGGPGYYGSGGPWVPPAKAMQTIVQSETHIADGGRWSGTLPRPVKNDEYRDVAVLAIKEVVKSKYQIPDFTMKALHAIVPMNEVVDLSDRMKPDGSLDWEAPAGQWTILRFGHAWNERITLDGNVDPAIVHAVLKSLRS